MSAVTRPLPDTADPDYAPFWAATAAGRLVAQRCGECGQFRWPPRPSCPSCQSRSVEWPEVNGVGSLYSWTRIGHAYLAAFKDKVPYTVGIVELDEPAVRYVGTILSENPADVRIGARCRVEFEEVAGIRLPVWRIETERAAK